MSEKIISPGIFTQENDQSFISKGVDQIGAALLGPTVRGPIMVPTKVTNYSEYNSIFGTNFKSGSQYYEYLTSHTAKTYFDNGGSSLWVVGIKSGSYTQFSTYSSASVSNSTPTSIGSFASASFIITANMTGSYPYNKISLGPLSNFTLYFNQWSSPGNNYYDSTLNMLYVGTFGLTNLNDYAQYAASAINTSSFETSLIFSGSFNSNTLTIKNITGGTLGNSYSVTSSMQYWGNVGSGAGISSSFSGGSEAQYQNRAFTIESLSYGTIMNNSSSLSSTNALSSGSFDNVRWEVVNSDGTKGTFTLLVRSGNDNENQKNILESWNNLSLDPSQPNYISNVIGDSKKVFYKDPSTGEMYIQESGSYQNNSQYVRIKSVESILNNSIDNDGNFKTNLSSSLPLNGSGSFGGSFSGGIDGAGVKHPQYMYENITNTSTNSQGLISSDYIDAISLISNKDEYDYNLLLIPGLIAGNSNLSSAINATINMVENREDCFLITDISGFGTTRQTTINNAVFSNSNYVGTYWPWVQIKDNMNKNVWVPPSVVMGGALAFNDAVSAEWFAPAGTLRGGLSSVIKAERKLSKDDRDLLYNSNINPISTFPKNGVLAFGQKTLQKKSSSLNRINVRRLLISLKRFIGQTSLDLVFEQNTINTRNKFLSVVEPYLDSVIEKQGIYAYKIEIGDDINTADVIDRNELRGIIKIQPTRTIEFIILNFNITPTGVAFS